MDWQLQTAKNQLSALIDRVEDGEEQVITRHGKPVAVVVPYARWQQRAGEGPSLYAALRPADPALAGALDDLAQILDGIRRNEGPARPVEFG